ncbi:hypothetical protein GCK72_001217 [Caenorhabditis remanei]|nr:hypothetical protein GCK72_001217 [Caenorhabditis remanei]KAF1769400.1 hypothetical protein GCK72_001217 [Caenorhabditis remanei]
MGETAAVVQDDADAKIIKQLEYYFGNINLPRDKFLQEKIKEDDGWVPITTMLNFNRLAAISKDTEKIANAIKSSGSEIVTVSEDNQKIRRNAENPVPENSLEYWQKIKHRTVYMKGFNTDTQLDDIIQWANQFGETENVLMRRLKPGDRTFKGSVFITYKTREEAEAAQKADAKFGETELTKMMQDEYWTLKNKETKEARAANKAAKSAKNTAEAVESEKAQNAVHFEKGLILAVDGLSGDSSVDSIKTFFKQFGSVGYVAHENGSKTAEIRFNNDSEGGAQKAWDKAAEAGTDGKVILQEAEIVGRVLEGEEEEKYWTEFNNRKNQKQGGFHGGRGGRNNRGGRGGRGGRGRGGRGGRGGRDDRRAEKRGADGDDNGSDGPKAKRTVFNDDGAPAEAAAE